MKQSQINVIFFGSSQYCLPVLESLHQNFNLTAIITKPDRLVGRKQIPTPTESKIFGQKHKIEILTPADKTELLSLKNKLEEAEPDIAVAADYGLIIPKEIIEIPKFKTINIHFSKLPDLRGASPVQYTILRGDNCAWISYMIMDEGMDTGDILCQKEVPIGGNETSEELYKKLFNIAAGGLPGVLKQYVKNELKPVKQDNSKATYTKILKRQDGSIPWDIIYNSIEGKSSTLPKESILSFPLFHCSIAPLLIERAVRAFSPWPGIWTEVEIKQSAQDTSEGGTGKKRLKILKAHTESTTTNRQLTTKLIIDQVQLEGKKPVSWRQFRKGYPSLFEV